MKNERGASILKVIIIVAIIVIGIILLMQVMPKTEYEYKPETDTVGKSTTDYNSLLNKKPSAQQISSAKTIDYRSLYKGANTLNGNFYKLSGEIVQKVEEHIYHVHMTKNVIDYTYIEDSVYYTDRIQISVIGTPSEILMEGDIVSFTGESLGNTSYYTVAGSSNEIPFLRVYAENIKVIGYTE